MYVVDQKRDLETEKTPSPIFPPPIVLNCWITVPCYCASVPVVCSSFPVSVQLSSASCPALRRIQAAFQGISPTCCSGRRWHMETLPHWRKICQMKNIYIIMLHTNGIYCKVARNLQRHKKEKTIARIRSFNPQLSPCSNQIPASILPVKMASQCTANRPWRNFPHPT